MVFHEIDNINSQLKQSHESFFSRQPSFDKQLKCFWYASHFIKQNVKDVVKDLRCNEMDSFSCLSRHF